MVWGGGLYFAARIACLPLDVLGVQYIRSLVWLVAGVELALMFFSVIV
jgi:uncharacterized MAPEG superfamily protein